MSKTKFNFAYAWAALCLLLLPLSVFAAITALFETPQGNFEMELFESDAPVTVENFLSYIEDGSYADSFIHRSEANFVLQGGSYTYTDGILGEVVAKSAIVNEFSRPNTHGTIAMAKLPGNANSATSSWFINLSDNTILDTENSGYTVFGEVTSDAGLDVIHAIASLPVYNAGSAFGTMPLINFSGTGTILSENLVITNISIPTSLNEIHNVGVSNSVNFPNPAPADNVQFTVTVANSGPEAASNVTVQNPVPAGMTLTGAPSVSQGSFNSSTGIWQIGPMTSSGSVTMTLPAKPQQFTVPRCYVNRSRIINHGGYDPARSNNTAASTVYVGGATSCTELVVTVSPRVANQTICPSTTLDFLVYDITVRNDGPDIAENIGVSLNGSLGSTGQTAQDNGLTFTEIQPGATASGSLSWNLACPRSEQAAAYTVTVTTDSIISAGSVMVVDSEFSVDARSSTSTTSSTSSSSDSGGGGGGCFIATAAYGSYMDPHVATLRRFRDNVLMQSGPGREFVALYYRYSPPLAAVIAENEFLRSITRVMLTPIVYAVAYPVIALLVLVGALALVGRRRKHLMFG